MTMHVDSPEYKELQQRHSDLGERLNDFIAHAPGKEWWGKEAWEQYRGMVSEIQEIEKIIYPDGDDETPEDSPLRTTVTRMVAWECPCGFENFTDVKADKPVCERCKQDYGWQQACWLDMVNYEETVDCDGNVDFDAYIPDYPDDFIETEPPDMPEPTPEELAAPDAPLLPGEDVPF